MNWLSVFLRPWAVAVAWVCTVASLIFGIWTYVDSKAARRLTYTVDGSATQIVKTGETSGLRVSFNGQPLASDVSANQVVLWNAGKLSIKEADVLKPVILTMEGGLPILEASLRTSSREVTKAALDTSEIAKGRLRINWRILEHDDGVRLQIIYAGPVSTKVNVEGVLEGQSSVVRQELSLVSWLANSPWALLLFFGWIVALGSNRESRSERYSLLWWLGICYSLLLIVITVTGLIFSVGALRYLHSDEKPPASLVSPHDRSAG